MCKHYDIVFLNYGTVIMLTDLKLSFMLSDVVLVQIKAASPLTDPLLPVIKSTTSEVQTLSPYRNHKMFAAVSSWL